MFINYDVNKGLSINTYRIPQATVGDIGDVALAVTNGNECVTCELDGAKDLIEDYGYWEGSSVSLAALSSIQDAICEHEDALEK